MQDPTAPDWGAAHPCRTARAGQFAWRAIRVAAADCGRLAWPASAAARERSRRNGFAKAPPAPDLVQRYFAAERPDELYVA